MHSRLLIRPGAIGDCLLCLPVIEWLKADYTEVWTPSVVTPLMRFADRAGAIAGTGLDLLGVGDMAPAPALIERLKEFDSIISWYGSNRPEFRDSVAALGLPFTFYPALPPLHNRLHATDFFAEQAGAPRGLAAKLAVPRVSKRDRIAIQPFSGSARKNWPLAKFRELAAKLKCGVDWIAGPEEELPGAVRIENLWELACWIAGARCYVGNDSGITHLAAATGIRTIPLFGPTDPGIWAPRGENVRVIRRQQLTGITVEDVLQAVGAEM